MQVIISSSLTSGSFEIASRITGMVGVKSSEIFASRINGTDAPKDRAISAILWLSVDTMTSSKIAEFNAARIGKAISGLPLINCIFLLGILFEPARAGIMANDLVNLFARVFNQI